MDTLKKVEILADAAKYDVSCSSSGSRRQNIPGGIGNAAKSGICHSFTEDGRCISLLKILYTNYCIYDCAYCINRRSNDIPRASLTVKEVVDLTINFYRRNYIEGLFLSSGVIRSADYTMEQMSNIAKDLRLLHKFNGYIHLKAIPGANNDLIREAGLYADRLSVNIEIPSETNLKILAPEKDYKSVIQPMNLIKTGIEENREERRKMRHAPLFTPAGQSTQLIIGATPDSDKQILNLSSYLYIKNQLKRVYYSGYNPTNLYDNRLPAISAPPLKRENRLYQSDWLLRFYEFTVDEIVNDNHPNLDLELDPKLSYALRNPHLFPVDVNKADYHLLLRIPGVGVKSAKMILMARRFNKLNSENLKKMGIVMKRAKYFLTCGELNSKSVQDFNPEIMRMILTTKNPPKAIPNAIQMKLDF
ncbi:MAG: putative DNA modification/repair radical SAM protein [Marinilabiliaceae bacterium]|nr:putative DNA modification/repair radical SAM protein [Marinilabiliaceae bacterium]